MANVNIEHLRLWVEDYYRQKIKNSNIGTAKYKYYHSTKGYYKTKVIVDDIIENNFLGVDTSLWFGFMKSIKKGSDALESGGGFLRYKQYGHKCSQSSFYASRTKFIDLGLIIETPFKGYYILNPEFIIKLYVKDKSSKKQEYDNSSGS